MTLAVDAFNLTEYLAERRTLVEHALAAAVPIAFPETLYESMRYSLMAGGKRLRPILCLAAGEMLGGTAEQLMPTACALEMIHTMSLIHDDLPAMDNDDFRRGKPTNHKVYGDDIAILAGDALLAYSYEIVAERTQNVDPVRVLNVVGRLGRAVAAEGLVGGQVVDLQSEGKQVSLETLEFIHAHKTGALLEVSVVSGAILAGADDETVARLTEYSRDIGLAFQVVDDILDVTATSEQLGKTAGKDLLAEKATYPSLLGLDGARQKAADLIAHAKEILIPYGDRAMPLKAIADYIANRTH
ncbi:MAG: geranylgeranyl diphosphate synthase CrtE [Cyanobacteria bacterium P01_A01_bin.3]